MNENTILNYLSILIKSFSSMFSDFNQTYYSDCPHDLNLKNTYVSKCEFDSNFRQTIINYLQGVTDFILDSDTFFALQSTQFGKFRSRTKSVESIYAKIHHYAKRENSEGGAAVNKCLNDLFGSRIILPNVKDNLELIMETLNGLKTEGIIWRYYIRDKNDGYFAIHCYFREDNFKFPWELQIWDYEDEESNIKSHSAHENQKRDTI